MTSSITFTLMNSRRMRWTGHVARMEELRSVHKILAGHLNGRDHSDDLDVDETNLRKTWWEFVEWIQLAWDRDQWRAVVNTVMNLLRKTWGVS
jgi:hypothetical protein